MAYQTQQQIELALGHEDLRIRLQEKKYHLQIFLLTHSKIDCKLCIHVEQTLTKVQELMGGHVAIFKLDCANQMHDLQHHCKPEFQNRLPDINFLQPEFRPDKPYHPLDDIRFQPKEIAYTDQVDSATIVKFTEKLLPWYFQVLEKNKNYKKWLLSWPLDVKLAYFDDYVEAQDSPPFLRMISADFKMDLDVAYVQSDLGIYGKGSVVIYVKNETIVYDGPLKYRNVKIFILEFFDKHHLLEKIFGNYDYSGQDKILSSWRELDTILLKDSEPWVMVYVGETHQSYDKKFKELKTFFKDLFTYYRLNTTDNPYESGDRLTTSILMYPVHPRDLGHPIIVKLKTRTNVLAEIMLSSLSNVRDTQDHELRGKLNATLQQGRFPLIWFYDSSSVMQKLMATTFKLHAHYSKVTDVSIQADPNSEKRQLWNFTSLPAIYCFAEVDDTRNTHKKWAFQGTPNMKSINKFFKNIEETKFAGTFIKQEVIEIESQAQFLEQCVNPGQPCVIALLDGVREGRLNLQVQMLQGVLGQFREIHFSWMWVDTTCHKEELWQALGKYFPQTEVFIYIPQNHKVSLLKGEFAEENLVSLIQDSLTSNVDWISLDIPIILQKEDCQQLRQQHRDEYKENKKKIQLEKIEVIQRQDRAKQQAQIEKDNNEKQIEKDKIEKQIEKDKIEKQTSQTDL